MHIRVQVLACCTRLERGGVKMEVPTEGSVFQLRLLLVLHVGIWVGGGHIRAFLYLLRAELRQ